MNWYYGFGCGLAIGVCVGALGLLCLLVFTLAGALAA